MISIPRHARVQHHRTRAVACEQEGDLVRALRHVRTVLVHAPDDNAARRKEAELLARLGETDRAVAAYTRLASRYAAEGFYIRATGVIERALELAPHDPGLRTTRSILELRRRASTGLPIEAAAA